MPFRALGRHGLMVFDALFDLLAVQGGAARRIQLAAQWVIYLAGGNSFIFARIASP